MLTVDRPSRRCFAVLIMLLLTTGSAPAAVNVTALPVQRQDSPQGPRRIQTVSLGNELCSYSLTYDVVELADKPDQIASHWWIWTLDYVTLGMPEPSAANWYFQGFLNWYFDEEALHNRPATMRVLRDHGVDGVVEYTWDTPKVKAVLSFALASNSDTLLMFGAYEPKQPVTGSRLKLICYPTGFAEPRNRAVTTAAGTAMPGSTVALDLSRDRWVLYEDTTPDRSGSGSAGLILGTPAAFDTVSVPVASYGIETQLVLKPGQRSFALGLYDFPSVPDLETNRAYFRSAGDATAKWLETVAATGVEQPLPPGPVPAARRQTIVDQGTRLLQRAVERWQPAAEPLPLPWAKSLPEGPIRTVLFCPRYRAYETMELARRLDLSVRHLYWDTSTQISVGEYWPYAGQTGQGPIGNGAAMAVATALCESKDTDLFLCPEIAAKSLATSALDALLAQVRAGKGLLLVGTPGTIDSWPKELFAAPDALLQRQVLDAFPDLAELPGYRKNSRDRAAEEPLQVYRYGQGAVVTLRLRLGTYSALVPMHDQIEGLSGIMDHALAVVARAAMAAAGRLRTPQLAVQAQPADGRRVEFRVEPLPANASIQVRVMDELDHVLCQADTKVQGPLVAVELPAAVPNHHAWLDAVLQDANGRTLDFLALRARFEGSTRIEGLTLAPVRSSHELATLLVPLPAGGSLDATARVVAGTGLAGARLVWEVRDAFERLVAQAVSAVLAAGGEVRAQLALPRPVTVCHRLDVHLEQQGTLLASERTRFTLPVPYPYDDFTVLMWSYAGGEPVLQRTDRFCYELGADMMDLCHMGGYPDAEARRQYEISSRSGLRVVPYVTRLAGEANAQHIRSPCLHDPEYLRTVDLQVRTQARQAAPYGPAAFTLGDENYLLEGRNEACHAPESVAAFRSWLEAKYGTVAALNTAWATQLTGFAEVTTPMQLDEAAGQSVSFAAWIDHKLFMDTAFAAAHEHFARTIQAEIPDAKVGWDGLLGYHWQAGYDFSKLCSDTLLLNQTYTSGWLQGELVRSLKQPGALTGKWGNGDADNAAGFAAWSWHCLLGGDNSVWWWTSWGCDYIPFYPDLSLSDFGRWFFPAARAAAAGPGRLLLHATRQHSGLGILYSQADLFAATVFARRPGAPDYLGDGNLLREYESLLRGIQDLAREARFLPPRELDDAARLSRQFLVLFLPLAACLSDAQAASLRRFVSDGGTLVVDGRAGLLTGDGRIRERAALDELLGVTAPTGLAALGEKPSSARISGTASVPGAAKDVPVTLAGADVRILSPALAPTTARPLFRAGPASMFLVNTVGKGRAVTMNTLWHGLAAERLAEGAQPLTDLLAAVLDSAGIEPAAVVRLAEGGRRPKAARLSVFTDGPLRYLGVQQDFRLPGLKDQPAVIGLAEPAMVYDVRAGQRLGTGPTREWPLTLSRATPLVFALLPYAVSEVTATPAATTVQAGSTVKLAVGVTAPGAQVGFHVVRLDVFAPGRDTPHRQYSQNLACPGGVGSADIPLALSDAAGAWRIECRDVASGVTAAPATLTVQPAPAP